MSHRSKTGWARNPRRKEWSVFKTIIPFVSIGTMGAGVGPLQPEQTIPASSDLEAFYMPSVVGDDSGRLHLIIGLLRNSPANFDSITSEMRHAQSDDDGVSWTRWKLLSSNPQDHLRSRERPRIKAHGSNIGVTWTEVVRSSIINPDFEYELWFDRSRDGGLHFEGARLIATWADSVPTTSEFCYDGAWVVGYRLEAGDADRRALLLRSEDGGEWTEVALPVVDVTAGPQLTILGPGHWLSAVTTEPRRTRILETLDGGFTWGIVWSDSLAAPARRDLDIARSPEGVVGLTWREGILDQSVALFSRSFDDGRSWSTPSCLGCGADGPRRSPELFPGADGRWLAGVQWSRHDTFDNPQNVMVLCSVDDGRTWMERDRQVNEEPESVSRPGARLFVSGEDYYAVWVDPEYGFHFRTTDVPPRLTTASSLLAASPATNPSSGASRVLVHLQRSASVVARLVDVRGRVVRRVDVGALDAGTHVFDWNGRDFRGRRSSSGVYHWHFSGAMSDTVASATTRIVVVR